jgi:restriction endonuclease S subunit
MKEQIKTMWKEICNESLWRFAMIIDKKNGRGEMIDDCRTVINGDINIIASWFDSYGQIRYFNSKYPKINFVYPISKDEFNSLFYLYENDKYNLLK